MCFLSTNGIKDISNEEQDNAVTIYHLQEMHIHRRNGIHKSLDLRICTKPKRLRSLAPIELMCLTDLHVM